MSDILTQFAKKYYGEFYVDSLPTVLCIGMYDRIIALIKDKDGRYFLQDIYTGEKNIQPGFGDIELVKKDILKELAVKFCISHRCNISHKPIVDAIKKYEEEEANSSNVINASNYRTTGKEVVPYKIYCNYFKYFGAEEANKLIGKLNIKYALKSGIWDLFWSLRDLGYCETVDVKRLYFMMYVLSEEYIPFDSPNFVN